MVWWDGMVVWYGWMVWWVSMMGGYDGIPNNGKCQLIHKREEVLGASLHPTIQIQICMRRYRHLCVVASNNQALNIN